MLRVLLAATAAAAGAAHPDGSPPAGGAALAGEAGGAAERVLVAADGGTAIAAEERVLVAADGGEDAAAGAPPRRNLTASGGLKFLSETVSLQGQQVTFSQASAGCQSCCTTGACAQAYMGQSQGICCNAAPGNAMCCPMGAQCLAGQCGQGQPQPQYPPAGYGQPGYGGSPIQAILRLISHNMMLIWIILALLGCLGLGGPLVHYAQMALCGMSIFNCLCPGPAGQLYGDGGYGGGGYGGYAYGPPGGF